MNPLVTLYFSHTFGAFGRCTDTQAKCPFDFLALHREWIDHLFAPEAKGPFSQHQTENERPQWYDTEKFSFHSIQHSITANVYFSCMNSSGIKGMDSVIEHRLNFVGAHGVYLLLKFCFSHVCGREQYSVNLTFSRQFLFLPDPNLCCLLVLQPHVIQISQNRAAHCGQW